MRTGGTRAEAILDVEASSALTDVQKKRVIAKAGPTLRAVAQDERSQWRNQSWPSIGSSINSGTR